MADLALKQTDVCRPATLTVDQITGVAGESLNAGAPVYLKATDGKFYHSDANGTGTTACYGVNLNKVAAGQAVTIVRVGLIAGYNLDGLNFGVSVFTSATAGAIADATSTGAIPIGHVVPVFGNATLGTADKLLKVECY